MVLRGISAKGLRAARAADAADLISRTD